MVSVISLPEGLYLTALRNTFSSERCRSSGSPSTRPVTRPRQTTLQSLVLASNCASSMLSTSRSYISIASMRVCITPVYSFDSISNSLTSLSMRPPARAMRCSEDYIFSGCFMARPIEACRRARGERSSCETSCSRRRWLIISARSFCVMPKFLVDAAQIPVPVPAHRYCG